MSTFAVILAAAGRSSRFGSAASRERKVFQELKGRPIWLRAAEAFTGRDDVKQVLVVVSAEDEDWFRDKYQPNLAFTEIDVVTGGAERADSVQNALERVRTDIDFVAVHDAARPLITGLWIDDIFAAAEQSGAAIPAIPVSSTVKRVADGSITETVPRAGLHAAQTPQVFRRELLQEAYAQRGDLTSTDDAQLVEQLGRAVSVVPGSPLNIKITTHEDMKLAGAFLSILPKEKTLDALQPVEDEGLSWLKRS